MRRAWQELTPKLGISLQISPRAFSGLGPWLQSLHLQKNQLRAMPALPHLSQLELIDLSGNPLHCDCQLLPLHRWEPSPGLSAGDPPAVSQAPPSPQGTTLCQLSIFGGEGPARTGYCA